MTDELIDTENVVTSIYENKEAENPEAEKEAPPVDDMDLDFKKFKNSISTHKVEQAEVYLEKKTADLIPDNEKLFENFKINMFMGLLISLLDGVHLIIYKFISPYELDKKEMALDAEDQEGLKLYFESPRVVDFINRIPVEIMGFIHVEWLYLQKYKDAVKIKEEQEEQMKKKIAILSEIKKRKQEIEEQEEPKPVKKEARKKSRKKKTIKPKTNAKEKTA